MMDGQKRHTEAERAVFIESKRKVALFGWLFDVDEVVTEVVIGGLCGLFA